MLVLWLRYQRGDFLASRPVAGRREVLRRVRPVTSLRRAQGREGSFPAGFN